MRDSAGFIVLAPPLVITPDEVDEIVGLVDAAIGAAAATLATVETAA